MEAGHVVSTAAAAETAELPADLDLRTVARVIDGDTLVLDGGERVWLIGVDTPETVPPLWSTLAARPAPSRSEWSRARRSTWSMRKALPQRTDTAAPSPTSTSRTAPSSTRRSSSRATDTPTRGSRSRRWRSSARLSERPELLAVACGVEKDPHKLPSHTKRLLSPNP